jgi:hypothetical protein
MAILEKERYDQLVNVWKAMGLKDLAIEFKRLQDKYNEEKAISAVTYAEFEILRKQILPQIMDDMGLSTAKVEGVGRIQVGQQVSAKQIDKQGLIDWLEANGHSAIVAETVNSSTLSSFIKAQIADGEPIPDQSIVEFTTYEVASVVKG